MTRVLSGQELAGFIKERQAKQVRALRQAHGIFPHLAIVQSRAASPVIASYVTMKQRYGSDILIDVTVHEADTQTMPQLLTELNEAPEVHGIIVQLPLDEPARTDEIIEQIAPQKDVDGLGPQAAFDSATAEAINWLLAGYGVELAGKKITIVGYGRLVGAPLAKMWRASGYEVAVVDEASTDFYETIRQAEVVVTATGAPRVITSDMLQPGAVIIDAGTASENGVIMGDLDPDVRTRDDLTITPEKGGVGPLTITALFDHVIRAASRNKENIV